MQNKAAVEEQHRLVSEKSALIETVKRLNREVAKLESFKRNLLEHLQDEEVGLHTRSCHSVLHATSAPLSSSDAVQ
jgi:hypothetical protein